MVRDLCGANQDLIVPWNYEDRTSINGFCEDSCIRRARESGQHNVRPADSADHRALCVDTRALAHPVRPWASGIDDPIGFDPLFFSAQLIAHEHSFCASMTNIHSQYLGMVARRQRRPRWLPPAIPPPGAPGTHIAHLRN